MTERKRYAFWIEEDQLSALQSVRERDGVLPSAQIRRFLDGCATIEDAYAELDRLAERAGRYNIRLDSWIDVRVVTQRTSCRLRGLGCRFSDQ